MLKNFSVIGAGNLGTHLIHALVRCGYVLQNIYQKSKFGLFSEAITLDIQSLVECSDFIVIATQESKIPEVVNLLLRVSPYLAGKIVFHTANALTSDMLLPLRESGARVASFSPLQTFPPFQSGTRGDVFAGVYFLGEGDPEAIVLVREISLRLGAQWIGVEKDKKVYFHIAAVAASNFLISILKLAQRQLPKTGCIDPPVDINVLFPLLYRTLENVRVSGVEASLTGPFKRKETAIIQKHLELLDPDEAALYQALTHFLGV